MTRGRLIATSLLLALAIWVFVYKAGPKMPDFEVYWRAADRAADAAPLYRTDDGHFQFKYLPAFAVLAIPLGFVPIYPAKALWFFASIAMLVILVRMNLNLLPQRRRSTRWLVGVTIVVMGKFYAHELVLGQVNIAFALVATCALISMKAGREAIAGLLVALAIVIKPYAVLFLPWLVARRLPASAVMGCVGLAVALALPVVAYGIEGNIDLHREWWRTVTETTAPNLNVHDNISLAAMSFRWFGPGDLAARVPYVAAAVLLGVVGLVFLWRRGITFPEGIEGGLLLTLMPLLSPQGWDYVFLIATPAIVFLANYEDLLPQPLRIVTMIAAAAVGLVIFDLVGRTLYYEWMRLSGISICFFIIIAALAVLRRRKVA
jgi:arabinofuranan 3-O-arabinosyltransferase